MKSYKQFCTEANTVLTENAATAGTLTKPRTGNALTRLRTSVGQALSPVTQFRDRVGQAISPVTTPVNRFLNRVQPLKNLQRFDYATKITDPNTSLLDKGKAALGVVAPYATWTGDAILGQAKSGSGLDRLTQAASKNVHIPTGTGVKIGQNPETDIGRRLGNKIGQGFNALGNQVKRYSDWAKKNNVRPGY
jgi:hypothetical protein